MIMPCANAIRKNKIRVRKTIEFENLSIDFLLSENWLRYSGDIVCDGVNHNSNHANESAKFIMEIWEKLVS